MFFIISTGRSGTKTIAQLLSQVEGIRCLHEPAPELIRESSAYHYGEYSQTDLEELLQSTRFKSIDGSIYCESNQTLSLLMPLIRNVFPEARFIWLIRNGLDFVASAIQKQWYSGHSENHMRYEDCTPTQQAWIDGRITADRCGDMSTLEWNTLARFEKCCWYWSYINRLIEADLSLQRDDHFFLRLEQIRTQFPKLVEWMGVTTSNLPNITSVNLAKRPPYHWTQWTETEKLSFTHYCGEHMDHLYPEWRHEGGHWVGVNYETPPERSFAQYSFVRIKQWFRAIRSRLDT